MITQIENELKLFEKVKKERLFELFSYVMIVKEDILHIKEHRRP